MMEESMEGLLSIADEELEDVRQGEYMTFQVGTDFFGIELKYVNEIIQMQPIAPIPEVEHYIKGLVNLRGKIIPVIDVADRFGLEKFEYNDRTCIIVITVKDTVVGLIVEKIAEVVEITEDNIIDSPTLGNEDKCQNKYVYGIGKVGDSVKLLLDPEKLIKDDDWSILEQIAGNNVEEGE